MSVPFDHRSILDLRQQLGLSQARLADELGCTPTSIRNWEHRRSSPAGYYVDALHRLCDNNGVSPPLFYLKTERQGKPR